MGCCVCFVRRGRRYTTLDPKAYRLLDTAHVLRRVWRVLHRWYTTLGAKDIISQRLGLPDKVRVVCDGKELALPPDAEGLLFVNIPRCVCARRARALAAQWH